MAWYVKHAQYEQSGEFWIDENGQSLYADGDIGEQNHEGHVIDAILNAHDIDPTITDVDSRQFVQETWEEYSHEYHPPEPHQLSLFPDSPMPAIGEIVQMPANFGVPQALALRGLDAEEIAAVTGQNPNGTPFDARVFGMKRYGWKRVLGNQIQTWTLTKNDIKTIANGLAECYPEDFENRHYNIEVESNHGWFEDVPFNAIEIGDISQYRKRVAHSWWAKLKIASNRIDMKLIETTLYRFSQAPPPPPGDGPPGGAPPGAAPMQPPPAPPSKYLFHDAAKNDAGDWGAYFTIKATGKQFFASEERVRQKAHANEKSGKPDAEISKALARIEAAKLNESTDDKSVQMVF